MRITIAIDILCMPKEAFSWISNPDKAMQWQKGVKSGEILKETPEKIGTTFKEELEENGKNLIMLGEITGFIPDKSISFHLESKIHRIYVDYSVTGGSEKSSVIVDSVIKWKFPMNIICFIIGNKIKAKIIRQTKSELTELRKLCES